MLSIEAGVTPTNIRNPKKSLPLQAPIQAPLRDPLHPRHYNPAGTTSDDRTTETTQVSYYFFYVSIY